MKKKYILGIILSLCLVGNVSAGFFQGGGSAYTPPNHTGDVTSTGDGTQTITNNAVTNEKMATVPTMTLKGRTNLGTGVVYDIPFADVKINLNLNNVTNNAQYYAGGDDVAMADGGTGQGTAQLAINALTNVASATAEHVLTKDTDTGNVIFKAAAGGGAVSSVFTRTGAVVAATNDYNWGQIDKGTSSLADITTKSHTALTDIGSNNHATIDTFLASKAAASGLASLDAASLVAQNPANATSTQSAGQNKIPIADANGKLNAWVDATVPGGANTQVQINNAGAFGGTSACTINITSGTITTGAHTVNGGLRLPESATTPSTEIGYSKIYTKPTASGAYSSDAQTSFLCHADGTGNAFVDSSGTPKTITVTGDVTQSTAQSKFGGKSVHFDGTGDCLTVATSTDFEFGTGNFTVDWWEYRTAAGGISITRDNVQYSPFILGYEAAGTVYMTSNGIGWDIASAKNMGASVVGEWQHLAVTRSGDTFYTFRNGTQRDTWTSTLALFATTGNFQAGRYSAGNYMTGYIDELRVSKGIARWTANFTPNADSVGGTWCKDGSGNEYSVTLWKENATKIGLNGITKVPVFADNAAAITGGLAVGNIYRTGAVTDLLCIVH
ncbi:MAG: LamG-like jellyroll fold domain-containing protein [Pedobacter sp.]|uniref:LamG-like jellyroll fold domain-containing protein n=1 Tax=Pedobacter sp. TaxID=1411316 RepID=UPI0035654A2D